MPKCRACRKTGASYRCIVMNMKHRVENVLCDACWEKVQLQLHAAVPGAVFMSSAELNKPKGN